MATQSWNPERYARNARFVADLGEELVDLLAPRPRERILDLGCGDGVLTEKLGARGRVIGIDGSREQVVAARRRGLDVLVADVRALPFEDAFDAVLSNAVLHWIPDVGGVLSSVHRSLRPGGRFVAEMGGAGNVATIRTGLTDALERRGLDARELDPWVFPSKDEYRRHLEARGFEVVAITCFERPTPLPGNLAGWLETFAQPFLGPLAGEERRELLEEVSRATRETLFRDGRWEADYVRLRFVARRAE